MMLPAGALASPTDANPLSAHLISVVGMQSYLGLAARVQITAVHAGKTLLARAIARNIDANFLKVVSSAIVDKYIGESARLIREMFGYAREHQPCIIFMDEIDAIGGRCAALQIMLAWRRSSCDAARGRI